MTRLLTVEDTFLISGRGLIVEPSPTVEEVRGPGDLEVELRLPDGTRQAATLTLAYVFISPTPAMHRCRRNWKRWINYSVGTCPCA